MPTLRGSKNSAVGLFVDGFELKLAKLSLKKGNIVIDELQSTTLVTKLEEQQVVNVEVDNLTESGDAFALSASEPSLVGAGDNNNVLLGLLSKYPVSSYVMSFAISEPSIYYHTLESDFGLKGNKLKQRVLEEIKNVRAVQPALDAIDFFYSAEKSLVCVVREDGTSMLRALEDIKPFLGKRLPRISLIEISDIALMNLARANYGFAPDEVTTIIYVGVEFTRLIFMKGTEFFHFAPVLGEGYDSPNIQNTVYSRLLLEQDNMGIPRIDKILLAGESRRIAFDEFVREQLPDVDVQYLRTPYIDAGGLPPEVQEQIPEYAVAIATAWKVLDDDHPAFYRMNLLPESVREGQRTFKLAWHGYVLLALVFLFTTYFTSQYSALQKEIRAKQHTLSQLQDKVDENEKLKAAISNLNEEITRYNKALAVYDSLVPGVDRWNKMISQLTKGVEDLGAVWVTEIRALGGGAMSVQGYALYRVRIPRIAALFDNATLAKVEVKEIREKSPPVYNFVISIPPQPEKPAKSAEQAGTEQ
ncbi:MAG: hypothetical protein HYR76_07915 [Ignavibacteria bacterium]|nr:hypothetical protein [Ignavibacteria bacterium]MBI3765117.1 hypothetical protein [Ignavibacteriales bacterium]